MLKCEFCERTFSRQCDRSNHVRYSHSEKAPELKRSVTSKLIKNRPVSILSVPRRTLKKILIRLNIGCSNCGWNECTGDIHHIIPRVLNGSDAHSNLTYLCPNCHRKAHNKLITSFTSIEEQVGDTWLTCYYANG